MSRYTGVQTVRLVDKQTDSCKDRQTGVQTGRHNDIQNWSTVEGQTWRQTWEEIWSLVEAISHFHCFAVRWTTFVDSSFGWDCERESNSEPTWILARSRWSSPPCYHSDAHWRSPAVRLLPPRWGTGGRSPSWPPSPSWIITKRTTFGNVFTEEHVTHWACRRWAAIFKSWTMPFCFLK